MSITILFFVIYVFEISANYILNQKVKNVLPKREEVLKHNQS
jgi:hypothetical protein